MGNYSSSPNKDIDQDKTEDTSTQNDENIVDNKNLSLEERQMIADKRLLYLQKNKQKNSIHIHTHQKDKRQKLLIDDDKKHDSYIRDLLN